MLFCLSCMHVSRPHITHTNTRIMCIHIYAYCPVCSCWRPLPSRCIQSNCIMCNNKPCARVRRARVVLWEIINSGERSERASDFTHACARQPILQHATCCATCVILSMCVSIKGFLTDSVEKYIHVKMEYIFKFVSARTMRTCGMACDSVRSGFG